MSGQKISTHEFGGKEKALRLADEEATNPNTAAATRLWSSELATIAQLVVVAFSGDGSVRYASPHLEELTDLAAADLIGRNFVSACFSKEQHATARAHFFGQSAPTSGPCAIIPLRGKDGGQVAIRWSRTVEIDIGAGEFNRLATGIDITQQIAGEQEIAAERARLSEAKTALHRSETMVASFLRVSPEAVIVTDRSGKMLTFSDGAETMFRCQRETMLGKSVEELMPDRFRDHHQRHIDTFATSSSSALRMADRAEIRAKRFTGEEFAAEATVSKIPNGSDQIFAVILRDLSERKAYEAVLESAKVRAEAATQAKSAFLATMSHEIRTPMNGVIGMLSILAMEELTSQQQEMVEVAIDAGHSLMEILNDILDYSRIEAGRLTLELTRFEIRSVLKKTQTLHAFKVRDTGVALDVSVDPDVPRLLLGDPSRIQQVLHNLIGNAVKFTKKGRVDVHAACVPQGVAGRMLIISVADTGIGMNKEQLAVVFDRFTQADSSITRQFGGSGLGLSIVNGLVHAMGGQIAVQSEPGRGSCFTVRIPTQLPSPATLQEASNKPAPGNGIVPRPVRVLVADDNALNANTLRLLLDRQHVVVSVATNGEEVLKWFEPGRFDLIFMDIQMPVLDGESALKVIRKLETDSGSVGAVAVACTAHVDPDRQARYLQLGFDRVLPKPVDPEAIADLLSLVSTRIKGQAA